MKKIISFTLAFTLLLALNVKASHIAGAEITYNCLGNNLYQINLKLYWDCTNGYDPGDPQTINLTSTCGGSLTLNVHQTNPGGTDISQLCPSAVSSCNGGVNRGYNMNIYSDTITLPPCDTWTISWYNCCRNAAITNLQNPGAAGMYVQAILNSVTAPCDHSPYFTSQPLPFLCINQTFCYNFGVVEQDGDSLYYSLINAMDTGGTPLPYSAGFTPTAPIPGITINPNSGQISFTPPSIGNFVVVVQVAEYNHSGHLIGSVMRDIQFVVYNCNNQTVSCTDGNVGTLSGAAVQTGPYAIDICEGSTFSFGITYTDPNAGDSLSLLSNISVVLPGSTFTTTGANPLTATIGWTAPVGSANTNTSFSITVKDNACPVPGVQTFIYKVNIVTRTYGWFDQIICGNQTAALSATGGSIFNWDVLNGPAMVVGTNFSCNPCATPFASPASTSVYEVVSNLGCGVSKDTVTVTVVPDFTISMTQGATSACLSQAPIQLNAVISPSGTYTYLWEATNSLTSYTTANPLANITSSGTHVYDVTVTSSQGCVKKDSIAITVYPSFPPNAFAYGAPSPICVGDTVHLGVTFGSSVPSVCGTNPVGCSSPSVAIVGTGTSTNTNMTYPAPYGNYYTSAKHQFLFKAAELHAAGITGGKIDQLDFNVAQINGITTYHQYTINMGCTNATSLGNSWISGLYNVYTPKVFNVVTGWNAHHFDNAFEWDGISNIVVEICFTEGPGTNGYANYTLNCTSPYTVTPFVSCSYEGSDIGPACPNLTPTLFFFNNGSNRPNVRFHYCGSAPDSSKYTYSWFPPSGILNPHVQTTATVLPGTTNYYVIVTDTVSGCLDTAHVNIIAGTPTILNVNAGHDTTICPGTSTTLTATGAQHYIWSPSTGLSSTNTATTIASPASTTTYKVTGTGNCAIGLAKDSVKVSVFSGSTLRVNVGANYEVCGTSPFNLTATSSGGYGGNTYSWTLITGTIADSIHYPNSTHAYVVPTQENTNTYRVTVKDTCGNTASDEVVVTVHLGCKLTIPNVFTPNGDGINDNFIIKGVGIKAYSIAIYDRWGLKVYESNDISQSWDGKNSEDGTYYYIIKAESASGKQYDEKGYVLRIAK